MAVPNRSGTAAASLQARGAWHEDAVPPSVSNLVRTPQYDAFCRTLAARGFSGLIETDISHRIVAATDNSIYQVLPEAILFPAGVDDLRLIAALADEPSFHDIVLRPRGGATGTNGQSLGRGAVVDCSRFMNRILEINLEERWVRVEPGVVKDQLNEALAPHGLFFAPELSTSNRATIGGMISTDACGQGSCRYGKTSNHVLGLDVVLIGGELLTTGPVTRSKIALEHGRVGTVLRALEKISREQAQAIEHHFPKLNRSLTGYDLAHIRTDDDNVDARGVVCGSEGTLGLIAEARLNLLPIPKHSRLVVVFYEDFDRALRDAPTMAGLGAVSVETIDRRVLELARSDIVWPDIAHLFPDQVAYGTNIAEFSGDDLALLAQEILRCTTMLDTSPGRRGYTTVEGADVERVWSMRKRAVGLLAKVPGKARPIPFVEDCAVPPERLADFIADFRVVLDTEGLEYGMFGHVDAGVLHVRPALDMTDPSQALVVRRVTDKVVALAEKYGGLLWGEHGKGVRSEFVPRFFGPLYPALVEIKAAFDPRDQFNPGKIASARGAPLMRIDDVPLRGAANAEVPARHRKAYADAFACNGNGACFNYDLNDLMCPSYKVTRDRRNSPKGRAELLRAWLRDGGEAGRADPQLTGEVMDALQSCLSCKSCKAQCPVQVDVPRMRSRFLSTWYRNKRRPLRDHLVGLLEAILPWAGQASGLYNLATTRIAQALIAHTVGLSSLPRLASSRAFTAALRQRQIQVLGRGELPDPKLADVVMVPDAFTTHLEPEVVLDALDLLVRLGFRPALARYQPNGKPLHVTGMLGRFARVAALQAEHLCGLASTGLPLVGLDPAMTLTYRQEYPDELGTPPPKVLLLQEFLAARLERLPQNVAQGSFRLLLHCTERTNAPTSAADWQRVARGLGLVCEMPATGCCGMSGTWGHETGNLTLSRRIFDLSWRKILEKSELEVAATGFSCRCQAKRFAGAAIRHPASVILGALDNRRSSL